MKLAKMLFPLIIMFLPGCKALTGDHVKPEGPIEAQAAVEIALQETIKTATIYRAQQIEAQDNQALVGVDAGLIALIASDRMSAALSPLRDEGRTMTIEELDSIIDERNRLLDDYLAAGAGTSNTEKVSEFFIDLAGTLDGARIAIGIEDIAAAESARLAALEGLRALRNILAGGS